jgi:hypothetical protein
MPTPADLIPAREAAAMLDRSLSTIRSWVREGRVTPYRGPSEHPDSAPLLVSRSEVLHYASAVARIAVTPGRPRALPPPESPPVAPGAPAPELVEALLSAHRGQVAALEARISTTEARVTDWQDRALRAEAALAALEARARADAERANRAELVAATSGGSWWSRLLGTAPPPRDPT